MQTGTHDVILRARALGARLDALRAEPLVLEGEPASLADVERAIAELDWIKGERPTIYFA